MQQSGLVVERRDDGMGEAEPGAPETVESPVTVEIDVAYLISGGGRRSRQGQAALRAVARGILERIERHDTLRPETIPAMWPMTRHLVRRVADALVAGGLLERLPDGALRATAAGTRVLEPEAAE